MYRNDYHWPRPSVHRALIVEDNVDYADKLQAFFRDEGKESDIARDVLESLDYVNRRTYEIACVDLRLFSQVAPLNSDGLNVMACIKSIDTTTKVVLLSQTADLYAYKRAYEEFKIDAAWEKDKLSDKDLRGIIGGLVSRVGEELVFGFDARKQDMELDRVCSFRGAEIWADIYNALGLQHTALDIGELGRSMLAGYFPIVRGIASGVFGQGMHCMDNNAGAIGAFWSRRSASAIIITITTAERERDIEERLRSYFQPNIQAYQVGRLKICNKSLNGLVGMVHEVLPGFDLRNCFVSLVPAARPKEES